MYLRSLSLQELQCLMGELEKHGEHEDRRLVLDQICVRITEGEPLKGIIGAKNESQT